MQSHPPASATAGHFGRVLTDRCHYEPLDEVTIHIEGRSREDREATVRVCDPHRRFYHEATVQLEDNHGTYRFIATGRLGAHYVYLYWPTEDSHSGFANFVLDARSRVDTGDDEIDMILPFTADSLPRGRRQYDFEDGRFVGYISGDTWHHDGIWLRDSHYGFPAYQHWERDLTCMIDRFLERQQPDGRLPDGIERDGRTWRVGMESDVEYIITLAVWKTWKATGDDRWLARVLPRLDRALRFMMSDPRYWDPTHELIKRQHSCDTWDFDIDGVDDRGEQRHVIATCDQAGYCQALAAMAQMHACLGDDAAANRWRQVADDYRQRAVALLWDGVKFQHHVHLDAIDHGDFDESQQLAMGNTWAITRGMADAAQARTIVDEYRRRHEQTGDKYPWWSLQPGYPDRLEYFSRPFLRQGGYANGGLMPWVGGELCRGAMQCGREAYGVTLLRQYAHHLRDTGGAHVWYWPDGTPGHRTTNEVNYAAWGMGEWVGALMEGLAGIQDDTGQLRHVTLSPRWPAAGIASARVIFRYAASDAYLAYAYEISADGSELAIRTTGSGDDLSLRLLLPADRTCETATVNGASQTPDILDIDASRYAVLHAPASTAEVTLRLRKT